MINLIEKWKILEFFLRRIIQIHQTFHHALPDFIQIFRSQHFVMTKIVSLRR